KCARSHMAAAMKHRARASASRLHLRRPVWPEPSDQSDQAKYGGDPIPGKIKHRADEPDGKSDGRDEGPDGRSGKNIAMLRRGVQHGGGENLPPVVTHPDNARAFLRIRPQRLAAPDNRQIVEVPARWRRRDGP